jgi:hypothetical protein
MLNMHGDIKEYLGDGAYVLDNGCGNIWITAEDGENITDRVCLGPTEIDTLMRFLLRGPFKGIVIRAASRGDEF